MSRRRQIYEGKAKVLFEGPEPGTLVQYFKDDASAFNNKKRGTITEYYLKKDELDDPWVTEEHITAFGWASTHDLDEIVQIALRVNDFLTGLFLGINIRLVDFKLEFGRLYGDDEMRIVVADEIS